MTSNPFILLDEEHLAKSEFADIKILEKW